MTASLPPSLLALFAPRPPLPYIPPVENPKLPAYNGLSAFLSKFEPPKPVDETSKPFLDPFSFRRRRKERKEKIRLAKNLQVIAENVKKCK
jgi:U1 small nuclear ribonucleoprotein